MSARADSYKVLSIVTPATDATLHLTHFCGAEHLCAPYCFKLTVFSDTSTLMPATFIGQPIQVAITPHDHEQKIFHGIISLFCQHHVTVHNKQHMQYYHLNMTPWFYQLTQTKHCRIFQEQSIPSIFKTVCHAMGYHAFTFCLEKNHPPVPYCVQFNESHFHFLSRLLEDAGISYTFTHSETGHTMVLTDNLSIIAPRRLPALLTHHPTTDAHLFGWQENHHIHPQRICLNDYDYTQPNTDLRVSATLPNTTHTSNTTMTMTHAHYPGHYATLCQGHKSAQNQLTSKHWQANTINAQSNLHDLTPGQLFAVYTNTGQNTPTKGKFRAITVHHIATDYTHTPLLANTSNPKTAETGGPCYQNTLTLINDQTPYAPLKKTPRPHINGLHEARVVGPNPEDIHTDYLGRIRVRFFWQQTTKSPLQSSCWLRVAQSISGQQWGQQSIPRAGADVIIAFMNGNPDKPYVCGSVYNSQNVPPFANDQHTYGLRTHRLKSNNQKAGHALRFTTTPGKEAIVLHSEQDSIVMVLNNHTQRIHGEQTLTVSNTLTTTVEKGQATFTANRIHLTVGQSRISIDGNGIDIHAPSIHLITRGATTLHPVARVGDDHHCPQAGHHGGPIEKGSPNVMVNGKALARTSDPAHCRQSTDSIATGIETILINHLALATKNTRTKHHGHIKQGASTVLAGG